MQISVSTNFPDIQRKLDELQSDIRSKAIASAVNKTMDQAKTQMGREIVSEYAVTSAYVRDRLKLTRASYRGGELALKAELSGTGKRSANMIRFMEKSVTLAQGRKRAKAGTQNQLHFRIKRSGSMKPIPGAFIGNQGRTVFMRVGKDRLPIKALSTIDVPSMFNQKRINKAVVKMIEEKFPIIIERDVSYFTEKFNSK